MSSLRRFSFIGLALLLMTGVSCTSESTGPTEPAVTSADQPPAEFGLIGDLTGTLVGTLGNVTNLLTCSPQPYATTTRTVGPNGGFIPVGSHWLAIPHGALSEEVTITAEQMQGRTNSVRFSPEGLQFQRRAVLTMNYDNCLLVLLRKKIVYTTEDLKVLEVLGSLDLFRMKSVSAPIDHFSRYAIAY
jgi:hypothetical protein